MMFIVRHPWTAWEKREARRRTLSHLSRRPFPPVVGVTDRSWHVGRPLSSLFTYLTLLQPQLLPFCKK
eukprot:scaffold25000_cov68-Skeletonema_marinoi.AAC.3